MRAAPIWMRPEAERKVTLEDTDRRALIRILAGELGRQLVSVRLASEK
jgi:hypothetical protein